MTFEEFLKNLSQVKLEGTTQELYDEYCFVENYKPDKLGKFLRVANVVLLVVILAGLIGLVYLKYKQNKNYQDVVFEE